MKKLLVAVFAFVVVLSFGINTKTEAASSSDVWVEQDAKVSEYVYSLLKERAGFASYIYTDTKVSMKPQNLANFVMEEQSDNFFIGRFDSDSNKVLVTADGLVVSYTPKEVAHTIFINNRHFIDVQTAVKIFVGPTITKANYINFASIKSNKAVSYVSSEKGELVIPIGAKIDNIGYSYTDDKRYWKNDYGTILPRSLQPDMTHSVSRFGKYIDEILVFTKDPNSMNIFYTSTTQIDVKGTTSYSKYDLVDKFTVGDAVLPPPEKKLESIQIQHASTTMSPGEIQAVTLIGLYDDGSKQTISASGVEWESYKPAVAKYSSGKLQALTVGETILFAKYNGQTAFVVIQVQNYKVLAKKENVLVNKIWDVKFNGPVDIPTMNEGNIFVTDSNGTVIPMRLNYLNSGSSSIIQLIPKQSYISGQSYTVWVKDIQSALTGKTIKQYTKMDFTITK